MTDLKKGDRVQIVQTIVGEVWEYDQDEKGYFLSIKTEKSGAIHEVDEIEYLGDGFVVELIPLGPIVRVGDVWRTRNGPVGFITVNNEIKYTSGGFDYLGSVHLVERLYTMDGKVVLS